MNLVAGWSHNRVLVSSAAAPKPKIQVTSHALTARGSWRVSCIYRRRLGVFNFEEGRERWNILGAKGGKISISWVMIPDLMTRCFNPTCSSTPPVPIIKEWFFPLFFRKRRRMRCEVCLFSQSYPYPRSSPAMKILSSQFPLRNVSFRSGVRLGSRSQGSSC
jgi:hypothetical protein